MKIENMTATEKLELLKQLAADSPEALAQIEKDRLAAKVDKNIEAVRVKRNEIKALIREILGVKPDWSEGDLDRDVLLKALTESPAGLGKKELFAAMGATDTSAKSKVNRIVKELTSEETIKGTGKSFERKYILSVNVTAFEPAKDSKKKPASK